MSTSNAVPSLIDAGGRRVRTLVQGVRGELPAVVFQSTLGCPLEAWTRVQGAVAEHTMTISYDRSEIRWNGRDAAISRRSDELVALLEQLRVDGPVVVVGHAFGALVADELARTRPGHVAGTVFVDAWRPDELSRSVNQRKAMAYLESSLQRSLLTTAVRPRRHAPFVAFDGLPGEQRRVAYEYLRRPANWRTALAELVSWKNSRANTGDAWPPSRLPMAVLVSGPQVEHDAVRLRMQEELAARSTRSVFAVVPDATNLDLVTDGRFSPHVVDGVLRVLGKTLVAEGA